MQYHQGLKSYKGFYEMTEQEKTKNKTQYNSIEVSVGYSLGGLNYISGNNSPRGYKLRIRPITINKMSGISSFTIMGIGWDNGMGLHIADANRFSAKELGKYANKINVEEIAKLYCENKNTEINQKVQELK